MSGKNVNQSRPEVEAKPSSEQHENIEAAVRHAITRADLDTAATLALRAYGPEILGFLFARLRNEADAGEVFSVFAVDLWRGLEGFQWRCSARVWAYTLARNAANRFLGAPHRRPERNVPLSQVSPIMQMAEQIRSSTALHLRTESKNQIRQLREQLPIEDQELLILRVDKAMSWRDLATVLSFEGRDAADAELSREAARLRKRFQLAKNKLREKARDAGLISDSGDRAP